MILELLGHDLGYRLEHIIRIFYVDEKIVRVNESYSGEEKSIITTEVEQLADRVEIRAGVKIGSFDKAVNRTLTKDIGKKELERELSTELFNLLVEQTGERPDWGILTGVRPVRKVQNWIAAGITGLESEKRLVDSFSVNPQKANLAVETAAFQKPIIDNIKKDSCSLYISIPFCPTRCSYCSFVSHAVKNTHKLVEDYLELLLVEIEETAQLIADLGIRIQSVYIGGGTPTILNEIQLERLLSSICHSVDISKTEEFTLEAGRPDTITQDKLNIARGFGVNRVSINPQTLNQEVLNVIGREHTIQEFYNAFEMAKKAEISIINVDLIAGLPEETGDSFISGLSRIIALNPENITVHTLTIKKSSSIKTGKKKYDTIEELGQLLNQSREVLKSNGYFPYYLYRQKGTVQNQENVGYAKPGTMGVYNIAMMEEVQTVFGIGAGASTRLLLPDNEIKRVYNFKYPYEYISRFSEIRERKRKVRSYYERG